jgi:hypothetical protein
MMASTLSVDSIVSTYEHIEYPERVCRSNRTHVVAHWEEETAGGMST